MKSSISLIALLVIFPAVSMAQSSQPKTREEVRNELAQLRAAGYDPINWPGYPGNLTTAIAQLNASRGTNPDGQAVIGNVDMNK